MIRAGLPSGVVIAKIKGSATDFDTSIDQLIALSEAGVEADILEAMTNSNAGVPPAPAAVAATPGALIAGGSGRVTVQQAASQAANVATNFSDTQCEYPGIFVERKEGELEGLEITSVSQKRTGSGVLSSLTYGAVSTKSKAAVRGAQANIRTDQTKPVFWFCFEESQVGLSYQSGGAVNPREFILVRFDVNERKRQRIFEVGKVNLWTGSQSGASPRQVMDMTYQKIKPGVFKVTPIDLLEVGGEYAFYFGSQDQSSSALLALYGGGGGGGGTKLFAFGVD